MRLLIKMIKKMLCAFAIVILIIFTIIPKVNLATEGSNSNSSTMTEDQLRDGFVNSIVEFYNQHGSQCTYPANLSDREATYENAAGPNAGSYTFDCVGWVSCAFHWFLGLGGEDFTYFVDPSPPVYIDDTEHFEEVDDISQAKKGDVLVYKKRGNDQHVAIYIGDGKVLDMYTNEYGGLEIRDMNSTYAWDFVAHLYNFDGVNFSPIEGGSDVTEGSEEVENGDWDTEEVDLDELADKFDFSGMATTVIKQKQDVDVFRWFFEGIGGFVDYIAGILLTIAIKAPILGYTNTILDLVNKFLQGLN